MSVSWAQVRGFLSRRWRAYAIFGVCLAAAAFLVWTYLFLRPDTWRYYTDEISLRRVARDAEPRLVLWENAAPAVGAMNVPADACEPAFSPDGTLLVFTRGSAESNADLFVSRWDGRAWGPSEPLRALNSPFQETGPCFAADGRFLFFSSDRPGGLGGYDIWVARWDGAEFAWPMPLTVAVNSRFDEAAPACSPRDSRLYFASNRPRRVLSREEEKRAAREFRERPAGQDWDLFAAQRIPAGITNSEVERAMSMLYSLRESALGSSNVMSKLGGTAESEAAVSRALTWLAGTQETNGSWSIEKSGGQPGHDVAATAFALLTFLGRGQRHDQPCEYRDAVSRGLRWLISQQNRLTGDLRGPRPRENAMYDHGVAALALAEAYGVTKDEDLLYGPAQSAADFLADSQNEEDGGWRYQPKAPGDMSVSGWAIMALKSAQLSGMHVPKRTFAGVRKWLAGVSGGAEGGIYGYQPANRQNSAAMAATGYFCSQLMGLSPNTPKAFEAGDNLRRSELRLSDVYYAYYGTLASYQNQGPLWRAWKAAMQKTFLAAQEADGSWFVQEGHGRSAGRVVCTALVALCLEAHYRYTPLYGLGYEPPEKPVWSARTYADEVAEVPEYRAARRLVEICTSADETDPAVAPHGDYLYFASRRSGGYGGFDLYRTRTATGELTTPRNLGPAINGPADEQGPALRMAGFHLAFTSNREGGESGRHTLLSSVSRRVYLEQDYSQTPDAAWFWDTYRLHLLALVLALLGFAYFVLQSRRRAARERRAAGGPEAVG